jgi:hypothetical protein
MDLLKAVSPEYPEENRKREGTIQRDLYERDRMPEETCAGFEGGEARGRGCLSVKFEWRRVNKSDKF